MKNYIWDFDGTLYDTYPVMLKALMKTLTEYERTDLKEAEIYRFIKEKSIRQLIIDYKLPMPAFDTRYHNYEKESLTQSFPFAETKETLEKLQAAGGQHFILTHRTVDSTWALLKRDGLDSYIKGIIGSDSGFPRKPDPTSLNEIVKKYQLEKTETLMIGDRPLDIKAGENAGVKTCFYNRDRFSITVKPTYEVSDLREIIELNNK